jgi:hypothetical protein
VLRPDWGIFKSRTYPTLGNHELNHDPAATAHYDYFNGVVWTPDGPATALADITPLDYGGWRIFVANNHRNIDAQTAWMTRSLLPIRSGAPWQFDTIRSSPAARSQPTCTP